MISLLKFCTILYRLINSNQSNTSPQTFIDSNNNKKTPISIKILIHRITVDNQPKTIFGTYIVFSEEETYNEEYEYRCEQVQKSFEEILIAKFDGQKTKYFRIHKLEILDGHLKIENLLKRKTKFDFNLEIYKNDDCETENYQIKLNNSNKIKLSYFTEYFTYGDINIDFFKISGDYEKVDIYEFICNEREDKLETLRYFDCLGYFFLISPNYFFSDPALQSIFTKYLQVVGYNDINMRAECTLDELLYVLEENCKFETEAYLKSLNKSLGNTLKKMKKAQKDIKENKTKKENEEFINKNNLLKQEKIQLKKKELEISNKNALIDKRKENFDELQKVTLDFLEKVKKKLIKSLKMNEESKKKIRILEKSKKFLTVALVILFSILVSFLLTSAFYFIFKNEVSKI